MARIRTVKPEFWTADQVMAVTPLGRLLFIGLWNFCDDAGIHQASPKRLKAEVFPSDDVSSTDVSAMVAELVKAGLLMEYEVDGESYWQVTGWHHQKIDQPTYKHPRPDGTVPAAAEKRRANRAANSKPSAKPEMSVEHSPSAQCSDGDGSANVRGVFAEHSPNTSGVLAECSLTEGKGVEGSKPKTLVWQKQPDDADSQSDDVGSAEPEPVQAEFSLAADSPPADDPPAEPPKSDVAHDILAYLNEKTGHAYEPVDANLKRIRARLAESTPEKVRAVIDAKFAEWTGPNAKSGMARYLRPATLFAAENFANYVGQLRSGSIVDEAAPGERPIPPGYTGRTASGELYV